MFQRQDSIIYVYYTLSILVKMAEEDTTCRKSKVGATDFCLCTSRGFEGKRFLTVKSNSKVEIQSNSRTSLQYWIKNNYGESIMDTRLEAQMNSFDMK